MCDAGHTLLLLAALEHAGLCVASRRVWGVVERFFMYDPGSCTINVSELKKKYNLYSI